MNSSIKLLLVILSSVLLSCSLGKYKRPSQKYFHGYVNLETGEQVEGKIKIKPVYTRSLKIKPEGSKNKRKIPVSEIKDLKINLVRYGKIEINGQEKLLEMVAYGKVNLYAFDQYYKNEIRTFYYFENENGTVFQLNTDNYLEILSDHLTGVDEISDKLYYEEVEYNQIINLVRRYNQKVLTN
ncbi:hypothetical protein [Luteibaculum oceani]|uniref:Uncharacterized protein n=1 Tax=Luteibaculum oceani TaxID=1294296 RepID=A0A5C6UUD1_9FLAO|nr:hypothetical protein [Luteibaculum oceani]TXC76230.1 hypothetical protein FRX97_10815 [Luteibaculum oceani]